MNVHWIISAYLRGPVMMAYSWPCGKIVILSEMSQTSSFLSAAPPLSIEIRPFLRASKIHRENCRGSLIYNAFELICRRRPR